MIKTAIVKLRVAEDEKLFWENNAREVNLSLSAWIRRQCGHSLGFRAENGSVVATASDQADGFCERCYRLGLPGCPKCPKNTSASETPIEP